MAHKKSGGSSRNGRDSAGHERQLQNIVSLSALYSRLAAQGIRVESPRDLLRLDDSGKAIVDAWVEAAVDTLIDTVLAKVSGYYDREVETSLKATTSLIEPLMICAMGFVVGGIALGLLMPIFQLSRPGS